MNWIDGVLIGMLVLSMGVGFIRGFTKELLSLVAWIVAIFIASKFSGVLLQTQSFLSQFLIDSIPSPKLRFVAMFLLLFFSCLILGALVNYGISRLIAFSPLAGLNRFLGVLFGFVRGMLVVAVFLLSVQSTAFKNSEIWQHSLLVKPMQQMSELLWFYTMTLVQ